MGNRSSGSGNRGGWGQSSMTPQNHPVQHRSPHQSYAPQGQNGAPSQSRPEKRLDRRFSRIADNYKSLEEVTEALAHEGLESSNLIVGIDFTKSNEWTGRKSYNGRSLHHIGDSLNPYEQAISIIGKTLVAFDDDNMIPCFGFGDASTHDQHVFSFHHDGRFCNGFEEVLSLYREIVPTLRLAGPTSFAPVIEMATTIVEESGGQYHVLLIIADGQVTRSIDTQSGGLSPQEHQTVNAIVKASKVPLSIILVGVGDGPWDMMRKFDDNIPARDFDNFQFVNFTEIMSKSAQQSQKETEFALSALMELPTQYKATMELSLLGRRNGNVPQRVARPPPACGAAFRSVSKAMSSQHSSSSYVAHNVAADTTSPSPDTATTSLDENQTCPICLTNPKDMAFGCGHQTCRDCGQPLKLCPICRSKITTRIKLY
ncbi:E3 ubiquitin-protein ligase RGLG2-like [Salvia splendens]|uniref:E3 ubiquitin-protein ligase RGLG2-like n=1 Tax=Salvia splendens TaxID=180675 RepID=UPI001C27237D|nr:E3 ubiquitin-protein ligase RGLG2-like [Salvia splendens]XP_042062068.1 E3 ubiquitin-protein ligase RGLG2-like [Salvia splendens]